MSRDFRVDEASAIEWLRGLDSGSVDLVITDPPYESLERHRNVGTTTRLSDSEASSNEWFEIFTSDRFPDLFDEIWRILKPDSHCYLYCDDETKYVARPLAESAGFKWWNDIVWVKMAKNGNIATGMGYHWRKAKEYVQMYEKGKRKLNDLSELDVQPHERPYREYPAQKPVSLNRALILNSSDEGDLIVDPFCGSGSTGIAAVRSGRRFLGCDIKSDAVRLAEGNISEAMPGE